MKPHRSQFTPRGLAVALVLAVTAAVAGCGPSGLPPDDGTRDAGLVDAGIDAIGPDLGAACDGPADCPGGYCVDTPAGRACTYPCDGDCPAPWECRVTAIGGDLVSVCLPGTFDICTGCLVDADCTAGICIPIEGAGHCVPGCFEDSCPRGYTCGPDPTGTHPGGRYCIPDNASCSCSATNAGAVRTCTNTDAIGTCTGFETCDPAQGWIGCTAATAEPEVCDGRDNDCDQVIDDGTAGAACTIDVPGVGSCPGAQVCTGGGGVICQGQTPTIERCNGVDDNCNTVTDEGFPGLGNPCSAGVGACQRFGVRRCTVNGAGTTCSAVAGPPVAATASTTTATARSTSRSSTSASSARPGSAAASARAPGSVAATAPAPPARR